MSNCRPGLQPNSSQMNDIILMIQSCNEWNQRNKNDKKNTKAKWSWHIVKQMWLHLTILTTYYFVYLVAATRNQNKTVKEKPKPRPDNSVLEWWSCYTRYKSPIARCVFEKFPFTTKTCDEIIFYCSSHKLVASLFCLLLLLLFIFIA